MLTRENCGLIVIDVQGKLATLMHQSELIADNITALIQGLKVFDIPVLWLEQNPEKLGATLEPIRVVLAPRQPIVKYTFSGWGTDAFVQALQNTGRSHWLLCGIEAHICVYQTAIDLLQRDYSVELVQDCISSRTADNKTLALTKLCHLGARLSSLEMCLFEIMQNCQAPEFKDTLKLIK